jgi:uncharacterized membrane protein
MIEAFAHLAGPGAFPNPHAVAAQFPLALLLVALLFDLACLVARARVWLDRCASALYVVGTFGAAAAYLSGRLAAPVASTVTDATRSALADHGELGLLTLLAYLVVTGLRLTVSWLGRDDRRITPGFFRLIALVAAAAALVLLLLTVDGGAALVYRHGVGHSTTVGEDGAPPHGEP